MTGPEMESLLRSAVQSVPEAMAWSPQSMEVTHQAIQEALPDLPLSLIRDADSYALSNSGWTASSPTNQPTWSSLFTAYILEATR